MEIPDEFHFQTERRIEFADTDMAGIVHFANFLKFVESAEHAFFRSLGTSVHFTQADGPAQGWPRIEANIRYAQPAKFEDVVQIGIRILEIRTTSLRYGFWILAGTDRSRRLLASGTMAIIHVELAAGGIRKAEIPPELRSKLEAASVSKS